jgi:hypothetical protein
MNTLEGAKNKNPFGHAIKADATGGLPSKIELLKAGVWRTPYHGDFMITNDDLNEYVTNFEAGIGLADGGSAGAPIDFGHDSDELAAGWIKKLSVVGDTLWGEVTWSKAGSDAILNDEYKFFSPEFSPKGRGGWLDPEDCECLVDNVLTGGGLTNIPLFKTLGAIKASANGQTEYRMNTTYINASEIREKPMDLKDLLTKKVDELDDAQKAFIVEHKAELTDEQQVSFGLKSEIETAVDETLKNKTTEENTVAETVVDAETAAITASIKSGQSVVIKADVFNAMQDTLKANDAQLTELRKEKISASVDEHVARGAIKADAKDKWVTRIMADATLTDDLKDLPSNTILANEIGTSTKSGDATNATATLDDKVKAKITASNGAMSYSDALIAVAKEDQQAVTDHNKALRS